MHFRFGIDEILSSQARMKALRGARVGLVAHPASVTCGNQHSVDALFDAGCSIAAEFGPQHGMRGDVQDNMIETPDETDTAHNMPVFSLYGEHRRPTHDMLADLDIVIFDLQDVGCRIYTYITTLLYMMEACAAHGTALWVADRPNPAGRPIDGLYLEPGHESFVGCAPIPCRHGLTVGELAEFLKRHHMPKSAPELDLTVIPMQGYELGEAPGLGWPARPWINPSPNASSLNMARCFPGTVLLEGTTLSEGRGTTFPLETIGAPNLDVQALLDRLTAVDPSCVGGAYLRACHFIPTFHKHADELCAGIQIHTETPEYSHDDFKPYRIIANLLKVLREVEPDYEIWRHHDYEYEFGRTPIDVINGGTRLREWVDDPSKPFGELHQALDEAEAAWHDERAPFLLY